MLNNQKTATIVKHNNEGQNFQFVRENQGAITASKMSIGSYRVKFHSQKTGRSAFAYGQSFSEAYNNMIRLFYIKYPELPQEKQSTISKLIA